VGVCGVEMRRELRGKGEARERKETPGEHKWSGAVAVCSRCRPLFARLVVGTRNLDAPGAPPARNRRIGQRRCVDDGEKSSSVDGPVPIAEWIRWIDLMSRVCLVQLLELLQLWFFCFFYLSNFFKNNFIIETQEGRIYFCTTKTKKKNGSSNLLGKFIYKETLSNRSGEFVRRAVPLSLVLKLLSLWCYLQLYVCKN
jgi:hypothetical protein